MIIVQNLRENFSITTEDHRSHVFQIYKTFLNWFERDELFLFESMGKNSVDARTSEIGINPVVLLEVRDCVVSIKAENVLLIHFKNALSDYNCLHVDGNQIIFNILNRKEIWRFLRCFESAFKLPYSDDFHEIPAFSSFAYNTIYFIEDIEGYQAGQEPDISIVIFSSIISANKESISISSFFDVDIHSRHAEILKSAIQRGFDSDEHCKDVNHSYEVKFETNKHSYLDKIKKAYHHVTIGDVYQVQIGHKVIVTSNETPLTLYERLRQINPSPYMYLFSISGLSVIGASPELFIRIENNELLIRPIAGTISKRSGYTYEEAKNYLLNDEKEVAEHLMLVDLCRNDLSRVCEPQSLVEEQIMSIDEYSHVYHMVSTARAQLKQKFDKYDAIQASFPAGTMTGTPKIRAMEIIHEIEDSRRGLYAGALGFIGIGSNFVNTALCIRTVIESNGEFYLRASAGIVADSILENEYFETIYKMNAVFFVLTGKDLMCHTE